MKGKIDFSINCWVHQQYCWVHLAYPFFRPQYFWVIISGHELHPWRAKHEYAYEQRTAASFNLERHSNMIRRKCDRVDIDSERVKIIKTYDLKLQLAIFTTMIKTMDSIEFTNGYVFIIIFN